MTNCLKSSLFFLLPLSQPDPGLIKDFWQGKVADVYCVVETARSGKKSARLCDICERGGQIVPRNGLPFLLKNYLDGGDSRCKRPLALLVGQFNKPLAGRVIFRVSFCDCSQDPGTRKKDIVTKTPSQPVAAYLGNDTPFWQEIENKVLEEVGYEHRRLKIYLDGEPDLGTFMFMS